MFLKKCAFLFLIIWYANHTVIAQFSNITESAGINNTHRSPSLFGGGGAMVDINNDGWLDIVLTGGLNTDKVYLNSYNGTFSNAQDLLPQNFAGSNKIETTALTYGHFNNDECVDLIFTTMGKSEKSFILQGNCGDTFDKIDITGSEGPTTGVVPLDFDQDGLLDIYLINYIEENNFIRDSAGMVIGYDHECYPNKLFRNIGNFEFIEITDSLEAAGNGCALAALSFLDEDNAPSIYIANDFGEWIQPNELLQYNQDSIRFLERANSKGLDIGLFGMGIAFGDLDRDLDYDIVVTDIGQSAVMESSDNQYENVHTSIGISDDTTSNGKHSTGWGALFVDIDNDQDEDLLIAKGFIPSAPFLNVAAVDSSRLFVNEGNNFSEKSDWLGGPLTGYNRGVIAGDMDNDGDQDLLFTTVSLQDDNGFVDSKTQLLRNDTDNGHNFINLELIRSNVQSTIGTEIQIYTDSIIQSKMIFAGGTHASRTSDWVHFGLNQFSKIDSITVTWPNGIYTTWPDLPINEFIQIAEGKSSIEIKGCTDSSSNDYNDKATISIACRNISTSFRTSSPISIDHYYSSEQKTYFLYSPAAHLNQVVVSDLLGRTRFNIEITNRSDFMLKMDYLETGIYFISLLDKHGRIYDTLKAFIR